jgi:hypothetical protein
LGRLFGAQDIEIGHPDFDRAHDVKGSDEARVRRFFGDAPIRSALRSLHQLFALILERLRAMGCIAGARA